MTADLAELLHQAQDGSEEALELLLLWHTKDVERFICRRMTSTDQVRFSAEDVLQQTFCQAFLHIADFQPESDTSFLSWLYSIANNQLADLRRHRNRDKRSGKYVRIDGHASSDRSAAFLLENWVLDGSPTPSNIMQKREAVAALDAARARLPKEERRLLTMRYVDRMSAVEIGESLGQTAAAVRGRLKRIRAKLRSEIDVSFSDLD